MLYEVVQHVWYELFGLGGPDPDAALWVAAALDFALWVGLCLLVVKSFWPTRSRT